MRSFRSLLVGDTRALDGPRLTSSSRSVYKIPIKRDASVEVILECGIRHDVSFVRVEFVGLYTIKEEPDLRVQVKACTPVLNRSFHDQMLGHDVHINVFFKNHNVIAHRYIRLL